MHTKENTEVKLTPMMRQYLDAKSELTKDCILLFRMGDFYEVFFDDAVRAAPLLEVALTKRAGVPMCGVPYHALDTYLPRLLDAGAKVAVAEQMEDPKLAKGIVKRAITRVITPGTIVDSSVLSPKKNNFLAALCFDNGIYGLASLDISTGDFRTTELGSKEELENELCKINAPECIIPESLSEFWEKGKGFPSANRQLLWTPLDDWIFCAESAEENLKRHLGVLSLDGFGCGGMSVGISAAGAVLHYAAENMRQEANHIRSIRSYRTSDYAVIDHVTQRNLEIVESFGMGKKDLSLLSVLDRTVTPMGSRLLREWLLRPLRNKEKIGARLCAVQSMKDDKVGLSEIREILSSVRDIQRITAKLNVGSANPRDISVLSQSLEIIPGLKEVLSCFDAPLLDSIRGKMPEFPELIAEINKTLVDSPPASSIDGGLIREGYNTELDEFRSASREGKSWIAALQVKEQEKSGIKSLKIKFNQVFGYYIEISKSNLHLVPTDYVRKQTIVNGERFVTPELKEMENKILGAEEKSKALENEIFAKLREKAVSFTSELLHAAVSLAIIDVLAGFAECAAIQGYCRPEITEENIVDIIDGRHPVLDTVMSAERFVPNDTFLDSDKNRIMIITGPNMAGKSTYIRQVALIVLMAQAGSFVPAKSARIGMADRIFTRVGASDDISRGQSTFMVEMIETANILNNATDKSLIILDEIGRGTSTFDGISIAWAVAEFLHDNPKCRARTLFATHYHELTELSLTCEGVKNYNVAVREYGEQVIFLRKILKGATDKSYGIHVAKLAGLPKEVIDRANEILENLENNAIGEAGKPTLAEHRKTKRKTTLAADDSQQTLFDWAGHMK